LCSLLYGHRSLFSDEVGKIEKKEDQSEGEEIHVEAEKHASVVEVPAALHAACGVCCAGNGGERGKNEPERGTQVRRMREKDRDSQAAEDENVGPNQRRDARVEDARHQEFSLVLLGGSVLLRARSKGNSKGFNADGAEEKRRGRGGKQRQKL
jgi:hypothetical protein